MGVISIAPIHTTTCAVGSFSGYTSIRGDSGQIMAIVMWTIFFPVWELKISFWTVFLKGFESAGLAHSALLAT